MKRKEFKSLIKEVISELGVISPDMNPKTYQLPNKQTLHLSHYKNEFVAVTPDDQKILEDEFGPTGYGHPIDYDETMRALNINDVINLLDDYNVMLTED